jgi:hypothetical protein
VNPVILWIGAGYVLVLVAGWLVARRATTTEGLARVAASFGLPLPTALEPEVRAAQAGLRRARFLTGIAAVILAGVVLSVARVADPLQVFFGYFTALIAIVLGGGALAAFFRERRRQDGAVRVARSSAVFLEDYRSGLDQWGPRVVVVLALVELAIRAWSSSEGLASLPLLFSVYAVLMVLTLLVSEIAGRRLVATGQPAGTELELAWDDAFKSRALMSLALAPFVMGAYFGLVLAAFPAPAHGASLQVQAGVNLVGLLAAAAWLLQGALRGSQQRYLRRLWPSLIPSGHDAPAVIPLPKTK